MIQDMKGKVAVVTGATSGIGAESARLLAKQGVKVALAGRDKKRGEQLEKELVALGSEALFIKTDVTDSQSIKNLIETTKNTFGRISYALNSAGIEGHFAPVMQMEESDFKEVVSTNLTGVWLSMKYELEAIAEEGASIINISTNITHVGMPCTGAYTASKAGVESLTKVAAVELGKKGVRVNAISPGAVDTPMIHRIYPEEAALKGVSKKNPLGKIANPRDIANTVLWLFSPLSAHVNGSIIVVDGGASISSLN